jgi:methyl-accepting chemotaxis protein
MNSMKARFKDETGLAERVLVGVIAWAFAAVVMLTSTLVTAKAIDKKVAFITTQVSPIDHNLDSVQLAVQTNQTARDILTAAQPLSGQLGDVLNSTNSIVGEAASIDQTAGTINGTVHSIDGTAGEINTTVHSINDAVNAINASGKTITGSVDSINSNVHSIGNYFGGILDTVRIIRGDHKVEGLGGGLAGAARRVDVLIGLVTGIKADTGNILARVGTIDKSAKSIDSKM